MTISTTLFQTPPRFWEMTVMPWAFQARVLPATSTLALFWTRMPDPKHQDGKPQPFSQTALPAIRASRLISYWMPWRPLWWTRLSRMVTSAQSMSHQMPGPSLA